MLNFQERWRLSNSNNNQELEKLQIQNKSLAELNDRLKATNQKLLEQLEAQKERFNLHRDRDTQLEDLYQELQKFKAETDAMAEKLRNEEVDSEVIKEICTRLAELEAQRYEMAEANLKLLEITEIMETQKIALGEANLELLEVTEALQEEKHKTEKLLLNILPAQVAEELKTTGKSIPVCFENVTVFFSDIVDFTKIASGLQPRIVIEELSDIFTNFDYIFHRNQCERIKTIGDAYLSVCGMPEANDEHARNILNAALEARDYMYNRNKSSKLKWTMRMGIHSGQVVGGIVGVEKYIYDIFGDTINTASRMERYSEPMQINVSEDTRNYAMNYFKFTPRPETEVKGKGKINMYFVEGTISRDK
jgi:class 3 adenylate cyclase